jgi:lysophospholipase II
MIFLHGRSGSGEEIASELFDETSSGGLSLQQHFPSWRWVFPTALSSYNDTFEENMREWFNISSLTDPDYKSGLQIPGMRQAVNYVHSLIRQELQDVPQQRLFLGGISQGGAVALTAMLSERFSLGGFVILCGWMPLQSEVRELLCHNTRREGAMNLNTDTETQELIANWTRDFYSDKFKLEEHDLNDENTYEVTAAEEHLFRAPRTPVFIGHSTDDNIVNIKLAREMRDTLTDLGLSVTWKEYQDAGHWISEPKGVDDIIHFLTLQAIREPN